VYRVAFGFREAVAPVLLKQAQQCFGTGAQGGDEVAQVVKLLSIPPAGAHQLNNPTGTHPALTDGVSGIAGSALPVHLAAMAGLKIADLSRKVPIA